MSKNRKYVVGQCLSQGTLTRPSPVAHGRRLFLCANSVSHPRVNLRASRVAILRQERRGAIRTTRAVDGTQTAPVAARLGTLVQPSKPVCGAKQRYDATARLSTPYGKRPAGRLANRPNQETGLRKSIGSFRFRHTPVLIRDQADLRSSREHAQSAPPTESGLSSNQTPTQARNTLRP